MTTTDEQKRDNDVMEETIAAAARALATELERYGRVLSAEGALDRGGPLLAFAFFMRGAIPWAFVAADAPAAPAAAKAAAPDKPARCRSHEDVTPGTLCPRCGSKVRAPKNKTGSSVTPQQSGGGAPAPASGK